MIVQHTPYTRKLVSVFTTAFSIFTFYISDLGHSPAIQIYLSVPILSAPKYITSPKLNTVKKSELPSFSYMVFCPFCIPSLLRPLLCYILLTTDPVTYVFSFLMSLLFSSFITSNIRCLSFFGRFLSHNI